ncbi:MAG TPA: glycosyltransferase [Phycisphaerales bacterium]|nr:glycosyltransferase [Phycisphaerales bacterium]
MPIRVAIQQPALPAYRVPVFRELSAREGIEPTLYYAEQPNLANAEPEGFNARRIRQRTVRVAGQSAILVPALWSLTGGKAADVLVASWNSRSLLLMPALRRARRRGVGTVVWGHGFSKSEGTGRRGLRDRIAEAADAVLFYNHAAADAFRERHPGRRGVFVAINSLDQTAIQNARADWLGRPADLAAFRAEHGLDRGPVALFVSRLLQENRVDLLLHAAAKIEGLTVAVIGKGPDRERLGSIARDLGIADRVRFPGAIYGEEKIAPWFLSSSVFVYPVNIGLSVMHAMGYGLPVVTSDNIAGHNPEIEAVEPGVNGLLYTDGDTDAMADAIRSITDDDARRAEMADAARRTVLERFTVPKMVDGMVGAIRYAAERTPPR